MLVYSYAIFKLLAFEPAGPVVATPTLSVLKGYDMHASHDVHHDGDTGIPELEHNQLRVILRFPTPSGRQLSISTWTHMGNIENAVYLNHNSPRIYCAAPSGRGSRRGLLDTSS